MYMLFLFYLKFLFTVAWLKVIRGSGALRVMGNNLGGSVRLEDFSMSLEWSNIGNLHLHLLQVNAPCQSVLKALIC